MTRQSPGGRAAFADPGVGGENGSMDPAPRVPLTPGRCRDVVLLGSTGSIGTQAADIIRRNPDRFRLTALAAGGGNPALLAEQALEFGVEAVAVASEGAAPEVHDAVHALARGNGRPVPKVLAGSAAVAEVAAWPADVVLNAVTGAVGLAATLAALDAGRVLALANKESLIMGGKLVIDRAAPGQIVPVDSEHSAIAQCLRSGSANEVRRLIITASGGPFLHWTREQMADAAPAQALAHPTWNMGPVITINSATLVNKGLEVIEAHLLFGLALDDIEVVIHRQSVIHSMVEFADGSTIAQASPPDMRIPIAHALAWPERLAGAASPVDWTTAHTWTFEPLDGAAFPAVGLARQAARSAGTVPAVYNAANEECVAAFTAGRIHFGGIVDTIARVVSDHGGSGSRAAGLDDVLAADRWARVRARELTQAGLR